MNTKETKINSTKKNVASKIAAKKPSTKGVKTTPNLTNKTHEKPVQEHGKNSAEKLVKTASEKVSVITENNASKKAEIVELNLAASTNKPENAPKLNESVKTDNSLLEVETEKEVQKETLKVQEKVEVKAEEKQEIKAEENAAENNKIKVLYVVSECHPFCATGGLADVAEGLPKFINKNANVDMRVVLPMYSDIPEEYRKDFKFLGNKNVPVAWRSIYCGVFSYTLNGVTYYFLDNEYYFKRGGGIYSYYDDGERFAFTSRAVLETISLMNFKPDIIHCNDWQSALIPIYLKTNYAADPFYNKIKTVFTLHNTEYQGKFDLRIISDLFGIDSKYTGLLEYNKDLNLVKGAIVCCDKFSTVSPTYAKEILSPEHSNGLDEILRQNSYKICGILNAIDCEFYNPKTDKVLYKNYDVNTFEDKVINKVELQKEYGLEVNENIPMMCIVTRMAKHKGLDLIKARLEHIVANRQVQFVAVGGGDSEYEDYFRYLQGKYPSKVRALLGYSNTMGRKAYGASDIFLMPSKSEPCGLSQMIASRYGAVPIVREVGGLKDSMWDFGCPDGGNAYTFGGYNADELAYSITRALNDYKNKQEWKQKIKTCMQRDFSWKSSAQGYIDMYVDLLK